MAVSQIDSAADNLLKCDSVVDKEEADQASVSVAAHVNFITLAKLLEQLSKLDEQGTGGGGQRANGISKNEEKRRMLDKFIDGWRAIGDKLKEEHESSSSSSRAKVDPSLFPLLRLLLPGDDRRVYGLKENKLAKYLIDALCMAPKSDDALKLINYRAPTNVKADGDFASVAYFVLKNRCKENKMLSLFDINRHLDTIAVNNARGKEGLREVNSSIKSLLCNLDALQLKWLIRIILKDLKVGMKEATILDAFHPDALDLYNFTSSLEKVCQMLYDPKKRLHEVSVSLFSPCRPMLGERAKPNKIEQLLAGQPFYIETKFDGERFQLHKKGNEYVYYSRNGHDYTSTFGADCYQSGGTLTPFIHNSFLSNVHSCILDGEMCGYNLKEKTILSVVEEYDVKSSKPTNEVQTCFCVFDVLLYNDQVLTNKPLRERLEYMSKTFAECDGRMIYSQREQANTNQQVVDALNKAIDSRLEGIVIKNPESLYKPSVRSGSGWFKVKPDYMNGLNDDLDLLIVGGYYGVGRRSGMLSHFLLAVAIDDENDATAVAAKTNTTKSHNDSDELDLNADEHNPTDEAEEVKQVREPKMFYSFCKIGTGYTLKELSDFNAKMTDKWKPFDKKNPPRHLQVRLLLKLRNSIDCN
jgi:DNA ligase 4